jgi:nucleoid-associated protein YgaU
VNDPNPELASLIDPDPAATPRFSPTSRYAGVPIMRLTTPDGRVIPYVGRRFVPAPDRFAVVSEHTVEQGDRLDRIAARELGDAELYWRLCDANGAMVPEELTDEVGATIRIVLPEGIPGAQP